LQCRHSCTCPLLTSSILSLKRKVYGYVIMYG
jgi:hypothetical protein